MSRNDIEVERLWLDMFKEVCKSHGATITDESSFPESVTIVLPKPLEFISISVILEDDWDYNRPETD
jgi:hypothetical protein